MSTENLLERAFEAASKEAAAQITSVATGMNLDFARDLFTVAQLIRKGHSLRDVIRLMKRAFIARKGVNAKAATLYTDKILNCVNQEIQRESRNDLSEAEEALNVHISANRHRYKDYKQEQGYGFYRKGAILLSMLVVDGFAPGIVIAAASQNKDVDFGTPEELEKLMAQVTKVADQYQKIDAIPIATTASSVEEVYLQYAKEYMRETNTKILSLRDDEIITTKIYNELYTLSRSDMPQDMEEDKAKEIIDAQLKPFCREALESGSPTAIEPGRNKDQYISAVVFGAEHFKGLLEMPEEKYMRAKKMYLDLVDNYQQNQAERSRANPACIFDAVCAKRLINGFQDEKVILRSIQENSRIPLESAPFDGKTREEYANWILEGAKKSYHREKALLFSEQQDVPKFANYYQAQEAGFTTDDLYVHALKSMMAMLPTMKLHLSDEHTDNDVVTKLMTNYPDIDQASLKETLAEHSPRAVLPGVADNYPDRVIDHAKQEISELQMNDDRQNKLEHIFNVSRGFSNEGLDKDTKPMDMYKDGKVAVQMLQKNVPVEDVEQLITQIAPKDSSISPKAYAAGIVSQAILVLSRSQAIEDYQDPADEERDMKQLYLREAQHILKPKGFPDTSMDVAIYKVLTFAGYPQEDIQSAIEHYSPSAVEPGRDEHTYGEYVHETAVYQMTAEKQKLLNYRVLPELNNEKPIDEYFSAAQQQLSSYIDLPYSMEMDRKLAKGLIESNYSRDDIVATIENHSAVKGRESGYGSKIVDDVLELMAQANEPVRYRAMIEEEEPYDDKRIRTGKYKGWRKPTE